VVDCHVVAAERRGEDETLGLKIIWIGVTAALLALQPGAACARTATDSLILRFDQAVYKAGGCAAVELTAPQFAGAREGLPVLKVGAVHDQTRTGLVRVKLREDLAHSGRFWSVGCVELAATPKKPGSAGLKVWPGDMLGAFVLNAKGEPVAAALAMIGGGQGNGRFRPAVDPKLASKAKVGAVADARGRPTRFTLGRVILREERPGDLASFLARRRGRLLNTRLFGARERGPQAAYHLVEVDPSTADGDGFAALIERLTQAKSELRFSSPEAMDLFALVVEEQATGRFVELDLHLEAQAVPVSNEGTSGGNVFASARPWFNPLSTSGDQLPKLGEGMALAHILAKPFLIPPLSLAVIDIGFAGPGDYAPPPFNNPDYGGMLFNTIPQCAIDAVGNATCAPGDAAGVNTEGGCDLTSPTCRWHGTAVYSAAAALLHNGSGVAGPGSPVARPIVMKTALNTFAVATAIDAATNPPGGVTPAVINMSFGVECKQLEVLNVCDPVEIGTVLSLVCGIAFALGVGPVLCPEAVALFALASHIASMEDAINGAAKAGIVLVASAGNINEDVDEVIRRPCVDDKVICVSSLAMGPATGTVVSTLGYGASVDVWAPSGVIVTQIPPSQTTVPTSPFGGTSSAAPIVAGALTMARAIAPTLNPDGIAGVLAGSTCRSAMPGRADGTVCIPSADPRVGGKGYLDLLELIRQARLAAGRDPLTPCTGGWDTPERAGQGDTFGTAFPLKPLDLWNTNQEVLFEGVPDLSIHALVGAASPAVGDEDWYRGSFEPKGIPSSGGFAKPVRIEVRVPVQDPSVGRLIVDVFCEPEGGGAPLPVPAISQDSSAGGGTATTTAVVRSDHAFFARVRAVRPVLDANCYRALSVQILEDRDVKLPSCRRG